MRQMMLQLAIKVDKNLIIVCDQYHFGYWLCNTKGPFTRID